MTQSLNILLVSRRKDVLDHLEQVLLAADLAPSRQLNSNGHVDPLHGVDPPPDLVVLHVSTCGVRNWKQWPRARSIAGLL